MYHTMIVDADWLINLELNFDHEDIVEALRIVAEMKKAGNLQRPENLDRGAVRFIVNDYITNERRIKDNTRKEYMAEYQKDYYQRKKLEKLEKFENIDSNNSNNSNNSNTRIEENRIEENRIEENIYSTPNPPSQGEGGGGGKPDYLEIEAFCESIGRAELSPFVDDLLQDHKILHWKQYVRKYAENHPKEETPSFDADEFFALALAKGAMR